MHKSVALHEIHLWVLRGMAGQVAKLLSMIFEKLWQSGDVPDEMEKGKFNPIFKRGKTEDLRNYRPVRLMENKELIGNSQTHGFRKGNHT